MPTNTEIRIPLLLSMEFKMGVVRTLAVPAESPKFNKIKFHPKMDCSSDRRQEQFRCQVFKFRHNDINVEK
jgi:hypothetical protein